MRHQAGPRTSCKPLSSASSPPSWCPSAARRPMRSTPSSTRWFRTRRTAACCAALGSYCTRRSPKRSKPCDDYPCPLVAASIRRNTPFTAPHPSHPSACKRRRGIADQSAIRPSNTAAAASPQSSAAFSSQRSWETHPPPKPLPRQIPIDGQALTASRGFVLRRLSDAGPYPGRSLAPGRHPKPFTIPAVRD
jgi:hypothetical protein